MNVKRLLLSLAALAVPFAIFLLLCEHRLSAVPANQVAAKKRLFEAKRAGIKVLVLGSSHAFYGILPGLLGEPAFNLSNVNQSLYYDDAFVTRCVNELPSLRLVILPVSYHSLETQLDDGPERWRAYYYRYEWGLPNRDWHMAWHVRNFSAYFLEGQTIGLRHLLLGPIKDMRSDFDEWGGWTNRPPDPATDAEAAAAALEDVGPALKRHHAGMKPGHLPENERSLDHLAGELNSRGIGLIFITTPVTTYYQDRILPAEYQRMQETLARICASNHVTYTNYMYDKRFAIGDFCNSDHLTLAGARKFSLILRDEVVAPWFAAHGQRASP